MIDEIYEVNQYLEGKSVVLNNLYRVCWLMARWHREQGHTRLETRNKIFEWGNRHNTYIKYNLNDILNRVYDVENYISLKTTKVKINRLDIDNINERFDNKKTKLVALSLLCYAKAKADKSGEFSISSVNLGAWLGINRKMLVNRYIKELIDFEYLEIISKPSNNSRWNKPQDEQITRYRLNVPLHNSGDLHLVNNDMRVLFSQAFSARI